MTDREHFERIARAHGLGLRMVGGRYTEHSTQAAWEAAQAFGSGAGVPKFEALAARFESLHANGHVWITTVAASAMTRRIAAPAPEADQLAASGVVIGQCGAPQDGRTCYPECGCDSEQECEYGIKEAPAAGQPEGPPLMWVNPAPHASAPREPQRTANYPIGFQLDESRTRAFLGQPEADRIECAACGDTGIVGEGGVRVECWRCESASAAPEAPEAGQGVEALAAKVGVYYPDGAVRYGAPLYAFTPDELAEFARRLATPTVAADGVQALAAKRPRVFVDMDGVVVDFDAYKAETGLSGDDVKRTPGAYLAMPAIPGAIQAVRSVIGMGYEVWLATKPPTGIPHAYSDKAAWVMSHLPELKRRIIITHDKGLLGGPSDFLLDDRPHKANCERFTGTLLRFVDGYHWPQALDFLRSRRLASAQPADEVEAIGLALFRDWNTADRNPGGATEYYRDVIRRFVAEVRKPGDVRDRIGPQPASAQQPASEWPECSGNPADCPENEGYGCCGRAQQPSAQAAGEGVGDG